MDLKLTGTDCEEIAKKINLKVMIFSDSMSESEESLFQIMSSKEGVGKRSKKLMIYPTICQSPKGLFSINKKRELKPSNVSWKRGR